MHAPFRPHDAPAFYRFKQKFCDLCPSGASAATACEILRRALVIINPMDSRYPQELIRDNAGNGVCVAFGTPPAPDDDLWARAVAGAGALASVTLWIAAIAILAPADAHADTLDKIIIAGRHSGAAMAAGSIALGVIFIRDLVKNWRRK